MPSLSIKNYFVVWGVTYNLKIIEQSSVNKPNGDLNGDKNASILNAY